MQLASHVQGRGAALHGHAVLDEGVNVDFLREMSSERRDVWGLETG